MLGVGAIMLALLLWRGVYIRRLTALSMSRRRLGPDGIIIGGEAFVLERVGAPAVLLLHGAGDTPQTLRYLGDDLYARGFHVVAPLLPGHGRSVKDFSRVGANELAGAASEAYRDVKAGRDWVGIIGLSMGGALAVQLAADTPALPALGLVAPYLAMPARIDRAARLAWLWGPFAPVVRSADGQSILDPTEAEKNLAYGIFTATALTALRTLVRRAALVLPKVAAPTIVIQSRTDNRVAESTTEHAFAQLGAREKRLEWITGAAHVITVDYGRERVISLLGDWMERHAPARAKSD
jgi:carboxylesterase